MSVAEELIPTLQQRDLMVPDDFLDAIQLLARESHAPFQPDGIEPELRLTVLCCDMDVRRFGTIP
jgi:hypothetical protein